MKLPAPVSCAAGRGPALAAGWLLFPRRLPNSRVPWEYQAQRPDTDHFNREYRPELASGGTEILQGLNTGLLELDKNRQKYSINHLILLTDGQTYGDEDKCLVVAAEAKRRHIGISTICSPRALFGIGLL